MIGTAKRINDIALVHKILQYMKTNHIMIDTKYYDYIINAYVENNNIEQAMKYIIDVKEHDIKDNNLTFTIDRVTRLSQLFESEQIEIIKQVHVNKIWMKHIIDSKAQSTEREQVTKNHIIWFAICFFMQL